MEDQDTKHIGIVVIFLACAMDVPSFSFAELPGNLTEIPLGSSADFWYITFQIGHGNILVKSYALTIHGYLSILTDAI
jgi:hypothetical protein